MDVSKTNFDGETVLDVAEKRFNVDFVRQFLPAGQKSKLLEAYPGDAKSPVIGKWAQTIRGTNLFLKLDAHGGGEIHWFARQPVAWKTNGQAIEIDGCMVGPGPGILNHDAKSDTCSFRFRDGDPTPIKLVRMK